MRNPKILDVGSGHSPHKEAGVIVDKYLDNVSRGKDIVIPEDVKFIEADICNLPFNDKEFSFVYCKHVLEHIEDVEKAISELMRVADSGYIEVPTSLWEKLFGRKYHINIIDFVDNKLVIRKKPEGYCSNFKADELYSKCELFKQKFNENNDLFTIKYYWKNKINYELQ